MITPTPTPNPHTDSQDYDDFTLVGHVLTRREMMAFLGSIGPMLLCGATFTDLITQSAAVSEMPTDAPTQIASAAIVVAKPKPADGTSHIDPRLLRTDIRPDSQGHLKEGVPLRLIIKLFDVGEDRYAAVEGAQVDVWHCDALGVYSDVEDGRTDGAAETWLYGTQITDEMGVVCFKTIYPGWYWGRAVHIHLKVRTTPHAETGHEFVSQLFFSETLTNRIVLNAPYDLRGRPDQTNTTDEIFQGRTGLMLLTPTQDSDGGYTATIEIGLDLSDEDL